MPARPPPPPPPPDDDNASGGRVWTHVEIKYGLDNYGSVGFGVGCETSKRPGETVEAAFARCWEEATISFNERDREIRRVLGKRMKDKPTVLGA